MKGILRSSLRALYNNKKRRRLRHALMRQWRMRIFLMFDWLIEWLDDSEEIKRHVNNNQLQQQKVKHRKDYGRRRHQSIRDLTMGKGKFRARYHRKRGLNKDIFGKHIQNLYIVNTALGFRIRHRSRDDALKVSSEKKHIAPFFNWIWIVWATAYCNCISTNYATQCTI